MFIWVLFIGLAIVVAGVMGGPMGVSLTAVAGFGVLAIVAVQRWAYVTVPEMQVGVIFRRDGQQFARFLPAGRHWIVPFAEQLAGLIPVNPGGADGICRDVHTSDGVPVDIAWTLSYRLDPFRIPAASRPKLARNLPTKSGKMATKHVNNVLRHVVGEWPVAALYETGAQQRLERAVRQQTAVRLTKLGFDISRVMIDAVVLPPAVRSALEASLQRRLQAEHEAQALARLQQVVSRFSEADMQRLMELERIHAMGQHGVSLVYPMPAVQDRDETARKRPSRSHFAGRSVERPSVS